MRTSYLLVVCLLCHIKISGAYLASFHGDSFLFQSLNSRPLDTTTVSLRFQTSSADGLLFLALGQSQYLIVELVNGKLEVKIDLGYGEEVLSTSDRDSLNNLIWHQFKVVRSGSNIKLVLNGRDVTSGQINVPNPRRAKLATDFGIFLGGLGGNITLPNGGRPGKYFRGCLLEAEFNGKDLLTPLKNVGNERILYHVVSGCPKIFRASRSESITFDSPSSYVALNRWTVQDEGTFECMLKTSARSGIILYNAGRGRGEFIGLEMVDGVVGASVNKGGGGGVVALHTTSPINDGAWHSVRFSFSPSYLDIRVDGKRTKAFVEQTSPELKGTVIGERHHNLDLTGHLYIGGVPGNLLQNDAVPHSLVSLGSSDGTGTVSGAFPGCMKNLRVNHRRKGFSDFLLSRHVSAGCKKIVNFDRSKKNTPIDDFNEANSAVSTMFAIYNSKKSKSRLSTTARTTTTTIPTTTTPAFVVPVVNLTIHPLMVLEGQSSKLTSEQLSLSVQGFEKQDTKEDILFVISNPPSHGFLLNSQDCSSLATLFEFSAIDLADEKLYFCHDASETTHDYINFTVVWNLEHKSLNERKHIIRNFPGKPEFVSTGIVLNDRAVFSLNIIVEPVNDPPTLHIPVQYLFRPVKSTSTHLPQDILNATDPDSPPSEIIYTILGNQRGGFHIENEKNLGKSIIEFSQEDINSGNIVFVDEGEVENARLVMRVSNTLSQSTSTAVLRIATISLNISVTTREITLLEKSSFIFTIEQLAVTSNAEPGSVNLLFQIKENPSLGEMQTFNHEIGDDNLREESWIRSSNFTEKQLSEGYVRYHNLKTSSSVVEDTEKDRFTFTVSGANVETPVITCVINVQKVRVILSINKLLLTDGIQEKKLTADFLQVNITHVHVSNNQIQIRLENPIQHAELFYNDNGLAISNGDAFTLEELKTGRISIKVKPKHASRAFNEMIPFVAVIKKLYHSDKIRLNVTYVPDLDRILLVNKGLQLQEGQKQVINVRFLKVSLPPSQINDNVDRFRFNITRNPQHGILGRVKDESKVVIDTEEASDSITEFTMQDIIDQKIYYKHDDSENESDYFSFRVVPILDGELPKTIAKLSNVHLDGNFTISIQLVNDQRPVRVISQPFQVVRNGERLLTKDDLWYTDADTNFSDLDLVYTRRGIADGDILNATSRRHEKIFKFTQRQIVNGEVLLKHEGNDFGRFVFWVRDGKHYATGLFVISASDPFVRIVNSSELTVIKGREIAITSENLWCSTNVKGLKKDITYRITKAPSNGLLYLNNSSEDVQPISIKSFTQQDIFDEIVVYEHSGSPVMEDSIDFQVSAGEISKHGNIAIKAVLESHQKPPTVQKNRTIVVDQGQKVQIRKQDLRIVHLDTRAADIVFFIKQSPKFGNLEFLTNVDSDEFNTDPLKEFTQSDINKGLVWYSQNTSFVYSDNDFINGVLLDYFTFDVSNKILSLDNLRFYFDIVPYIIPLKTNNFSVPEGRTKAIIREYLYIEGIHFDEATVEIRVTKPPEHGILESTQQIGIALKSFSYRLATAEFLYYSHDGSDFLQDSFSLQAFTIDGKKQSNIVASYVTIIPENDEQPVVVNNTGMTVWTNSITKLSSIVLGVEDPDTGPGDITYRILPPSNGWIACNNDPSKSVLEFTQEQVNNGSIVFVHKGSTTGGITFQVDDGENYANKHIFVITAKPLIIAVENNKGIQSFPGTSIDITSDVLRSTTNDMETTDRIITYKIIFRPKYGKIVKLTNHTSTENETLEEFTQQDIDDKQVFFKQDIEVEKWSAIDSFVVTVLSPPADNITDVKIPINITYDAFEIVGKKSPISVNEGCTLIEGEKIQITTDILDASNLYKKLPLHRDRSLYGLFYSLVGLPIHGNISISGENVTKPNTSFTQTNLIKNEVFYLHDHSDHIEDSFNFNIFLVDKRYTASTGKPWIVPGTFFQDIFNISITPVNDNPPKLLTKGKVLEVVDGFDTLVLPEVLNAVDPDNSPEEVTYSIIRPPSRGHIAFVNESLTKITKFTQFDVNEGKVVFVPKKINMTESQLNDALYFSVTDGIQRPAYNLFQIKIVPVHLRLNPSQISIVQAFYSADVTSNILNVSTNGNLSLVSFHVTKLPESGMILINENQNSSFSYEDVSKNKVTFAMTKNSLSTDSMEINVHYNRSIGSNMSVTATLQIMVTPLLVQGSLSVSNDGLSRLALSSLNTTPLLDKSNSMPRFEVIRQPENGEILKVFSPEETSKSVRKREISGEYSHLLKEVDKFSHEDIALGRVFIYVDNLNVTDGKLEDSISLRLTVEDNSAQPAEFTFDFDIVEKEAEDYSSFFEQFLVKEELTTIADADMDDSVDSTTSSIISGSSLPVSPSEKNIENVDKDVVDDPKISTEDNNPMDPKDVMAENPQPAEDETSLPWLIPVAVVLGLLLIMALCLTVVFLRHKHWFKGKSYRTKNDQASEENHSLTSRDDILEQNNLNPTMNYNQTNISRHPEGESLRSPACPGVTVTLLRSGPGSVQPSNYGEDRHSFTVMGSTLGPQSYRDDVPSTIYTPSTVYHYDDTGSVDFPDNAEAEFYAANHNIYPNQRLYHSRSARFIDPDVLALYSSDESIPSMIDEKYAIPYRGSTGATGSVPAELHRAVSQPGTSYAGIADCRPRSTASLSKAAVTPELSLLPNSGLESNQYWI
uniref:chondroitin sulfate proteoglycan 4-like n=1 Tax=Styela clava TaxID=7725 RepID=UPI00193A720C|nr:chondroitin sulfate proteoglycan 4-like [Styela clava]XP_039270668.1 chondroitin sulfate proteoglycan 4-like [Styela clava]XP_039270669.1 chondroitin sulfate proteoglycan 4-like [Styela clava]